MAQDAQPPEYIDSLTIPKNLIHWWVGGAIDSVTVTLRFFGDDLDPDRVSELLQCGPTAACKKGELLTGKRSSRVARTGSWRHTIPGTGPGTLEEKITRILDLVSSDAESWAELMQFQHDLFCGLMLEEWNRGCSLTPRLMRRMADLDLTLELDIYCPSDTDSADGGKV